MPYILFFHDGATTVEVFASHLLRYAACGYGVLIAGYPGFGGNRGTPNQGTIFEAGRLYAGWVSTHASDSPLVIWGEGIGSAVAVEAALTVPPAALVMDSADVDGNRGCRSVSMAARRVFLQGVGHPAYRLDVSGRAVSAVSQLLAAADRAGARSGQGCLSPPV